MKNVLLIVFSFVALIAKISCAVVRENESMSMRELGDLAADLELNKALLQHLVGNTVGALNASLEGLLTALEGFEEAFYKKEVLAMYCDDPKDKTTSSEILAAAFRKDLVIPFAEGYNLNLLPLGQVDASLVDLNTLSDLKRMHKLDEIVEMVKKGRLHFRPSPLIKYPASVKSHVRKIITDRMEAALLETFTQQTGFRGTLSAISMRYKLSVGNSMHIGSYLTIGNSKAVFVHLPNIQFIPK